MSYQVLARKWRPRDFNSLMGQEHVVTALVNALEQQRLHHAYLFSGTRGVGKTTLARILSKSVNCQQGVSSSPCGQCDHCQDIDAGRFVDLLEIDAASRTKVEDTREILDNVQYAPTRGRYKVYLIDEVHMLSRHSFNALLKTLEEPPPHVLFLLATTDPHKLPVTVLSRCLQFNLKALTPDQIGQQLNTVLSAEAISSEPGAISLLSRAAHGSMRDALSLTDQAIAQGAGQITQAQVEVMLGTLDKGSLYPLARALFEQDAPQALSLLSHCLSLGSEPQNILSELAELCHLVAMTQIVPGAANLDDKGAELVQEFAATVPAELLQLFYQILIEGRRDLTYAPDPRIGAEMCLLRVLAFTPGEPVVADESANEASKLASEQNRLMELAEDQGMAGYQAPSGQTSGLAALQAAKAKLQQSQMPDMGSEPVKPAPLQSVPSEPVVAAQVTKDNSPQDVPAQDKTLSQPQMAAVSANTVQKPVYPEPAAVAAESTPAFISNEVQPATGAQDYPSAPVPQLQSESPPQVSPVIVQPQPESSEATHSVGAILETRNMLRSRKKQLEQNGKKPEAKPKVEVAQPDRQAVAEAQSQQQPVEVAPVAEPIPQHEIQTTAETVAKPSPLQEFSHLQVDTPARAIVESKGAVERAPEVKAQASTATYLQPGVSLAEPNWNHFEPFAHHNAGYVCPWASAIEQMGLGGRLRQLALHTSAEQEQNQIKLHLDPAQQHLLTEAAHQQIQAGINQLWGDKELVLHVAEPVTHTPYQIQVEVNQRRQSFAEQTIQSDAFVQQLQRGFGADLEFESIRPN